MLLADLRRRGCRNVKDLVGARWLEAGVAAPSGRPRLCFHHLNVRKNVENMNKNQYLGAYLSIFGMY